MVYFCRNNLCRVFLWLKFQNKSAQLNRSVNVREHKSTRAQKFYKIFNHNTVKISYCCVKNMGSKISSHSKQVLQPHNENYWCNCRKKENCPLDNKCLTPNIIYEAQISSNTNDEHKTYLGTAETSFKERYSNHTRDFKHKKYMKCTELSKYIWNLKYQDITPIVKWGIVKKVNRKVSLNYCKLCLTENFFIIKSLHDCSILNKRSEFVSKCRHQNKLLLSNAKKITVWINVWSCILYLYLIFSFCLDLDKIHKICIWIIPDGYNSMTFFHSNLISII